MKNKLRPKIGVVGCGNWGINHIRTLYQLDALSGVIEKNKDTLDDIKNMYPGILVFDKLADAILSTDISAYVVATPAETHYEVAMEIINAGCHVLIEKPVSLKIDEAYNLKKCAEDKNVNLMAGHVMLFHPAIKKMKEMISNGIIGDLQYIYSNRLNLGRIRSEENVFWSLAPHDISIFQYFIESQPVKINSTGGVFLQSNIHDTTMTILEYPENIKCHIFVSWIHPFKEHRLVVIGSQGMISFEDSLENKPLKLYSKGFDMSNKVPEKKDGPVKVIEYEKTMPLEEELKYFIRHLDGSPLEISNADNAIEVVDILVKASKSLLEGLPVE